jgi:predicted homoserine dehydrogenase-like protein
MIVVDRALEQRRADGKPVRVALVGAGFMGRGIANQIVNAVPGMTLAAVVNRQVDRAEAAYGQAGVGAVARVFSTRQLERAIRAGDAAVTDDPTLVAGSDGIDVIVEVTGAVDHGAQVALSAIAGGTPLVLMNAELDGTLGPVLKARADRAGVLYTACDGDQPGVQANLYRFVRGIGLEPLVCGNIKGFHDRYRTPATQEPFARRWGQNARMVTSFTDGTKISFEQAIVANGTGMTIACRGMLGWDHDGHIDELTGRFDVDELRGLGGIVDYVVGARPSPGVFVLAAHDDPRQRHYLNLYKLGEGPLYSFYVPYHLGHFEVPLSAARAVLFGDVVLAPRGAPRVDVVATAKRDLRAGDIIDGLGGFDTYGQVERAGTTWAQRLLPVGLASGCRLRRHIPKDRVLTYDDILVPDGRVCDRLRREQDAAFERELRAAAGTGSRDVDMTAHPVVGAQSPAGMQ